MQYTVTVIKPTTNDRNSRVKCQKGTYVTHTCLFYLLTWLLQGACRPIIPYDVPVSHTHATAPTQYQAGIGSVPDQFWIGTDPVPDRYRPGRPLIGHCLRRASFTAPPPSLTVPRPMDNRLRSHSTNLSFLCWSRCPPLYTSGRLADH